MSVVEPNRIPAAQDDSLDRLLRPRSIAVIGASATPSKIGGLPIAFLLKHGYQGKIFPINPKADEIQGLPAYASIAEVAGQVDLAIVAVPAALVEPAIDEAIAASVRGIVLFSSGFAETGEAGAAAQVKLVEKCRRAGVRLLGPNCLGFMNLAEKVFATFSPVVGVGITQPGRIGLVSQSGAYGAFAFTLARERGLGLSYWITTGNEGDVDFADCVAWLAKDPSTDVILGYMEGCRDGRKLEAALAAARAAGKPVVITKVGRTSIGAQAAASHTAALAGEDAVFDGVFRKYGVYRAHSIEEFFDVGYAVAVAGLPRGRKTGLLTVSGGAGVLMADVASEAGLDLAELPADAQQRILERVPFAAARNPVDITGQVTSDDTLLDLAMSEMLGRGDYDTMAAFIAASGLSPRGKELAEKLVRTAKEYPGRVLAVVSVFRDEVRRILEEAGLLAFEDPNRAVRALAALAHLAERRQAPAVTEQPAMKPVAVEPRAYSEFESLALLRQAGVPTPRCRLATTAAEAVAATAEIGGPVVLKIASPDILHKSDIGGVRLNLSGEEQVAAAFDEMVAAAKTAMPEARIDGVLVAAMERGGVECIVGIQNDPAFGPVVMLGLGGVFVEVLRDVSFRTGPLDLATAYDMIGELRGKAVLEGVRGQPPADVDALAQLLVDVSRFAMSTQGRLKTVDINPVLVRSRGQGVVALDALIIGEAE